MHRSGTSLMASLLRGLSVDMGDKVLPADSHNQPGYFEDVEFLRFHQEVLSKMFAASEPGHQDWGWTEDEGLDVSRFSEFHDEAKRLLVARAHKTKPWGWKDPRTTLFLDFWNNLTEEARFILVYRFPWDVADSMQRLEAEVFLKNPDYAYRIWSFYNRRLRDFYVEHSDRCLLVSINALGENVERFINLLGDKLGLSTQASQLEGVFKNHLFKTTRGQDPLIDLVTAALPDSAQLLSELDQLADISSKGLWRPQPVRTKLSRPDATDTEPIDVSVITPCYDQGILLLEAVASVERHAPPRCELIIVNDGSQQPITLEILALLKRCGYLVIDQENAGLSASRNRAIDLARGRYVLPLDDDNRIREGFLAEAIRVLDDSPEVGIVYGDRYDFGLVTAIQHIREFDLDTLLDGNYIDACAVFRKQVWIDCQGFDPSMCPLDDWEFWIHAAGRGWRFHHIPRVAFDYRVRPGSLIAEIRAGASDEVFRKRIRGKHFELYWAKSEQELWDVKQLVAQQTDLQNQLRNELDQRKNELDRLKKEIERWKEERDSLVSQLAERDARIESMINSKGWRLLTYYIRFKHRYLLPVTRWLTSSSSRSE
jgi:glycosyltransferase involved in cell wall biosynthesis